MLINKVPRLACKTQTSNILGEERHDLKPFPDLENLGDWSPSDEILVEPLPNLPVVKDLVVDLTRFFAAYEAVLPHLEILKETPDSESAMNPEEVPELEVYANCILCMSCFGSCPVNSENEEYLGPAALAKLYRFKIDKRYKYVDLAKFDSECGLLGCKFHLNCKKVCPKDVTPNLAIGKARQMTKE
jgi:succinate dehydrogenase / fumarate reductase iron-sulfur subunit